MADPKILVNGKEYPLVLPDEFTLGEAAEAERITGQGYDYTKKVGGLGMLALAFISVRRIDPTVTVEDLEVLTGADLGVKDAEGDALPPDSSADSNVSGEPGSETGLTGSEGSPEPIPAPSGSPG